MGRRVSYHVHSFALSACTGTAGRICDAVDPLFHTLAQRHGFLNYLAGLLMPRDRSKTLAALVGAEPLVQAQAGPRYSGYNSFCPK